MWTSDPEVDTGSRSHLEIWTLPADLHEVWRSHAPEIVCRMSCHRRHGRGIPSHVLLDTRSRVNLRSISEILLSILREDEPRILRSLLNLSGRFLTKQVLAQLDLLRYWNVLFASEVQKQRFFWEMTYSQWINAHYVSLWRWPVLGSTSLYSQTGASSLLTPNASVRGCAVLARRPVSSQTAASSLLVSNASVTRKC